MNHHGKTQKDRKKREHRGPTFVGLSPIYEKTRDQRRESSWKKHKNQQIDPEN